MEIKVYDNTKDYAISDSGNVFFNIFTHSTSLLYIYPGFFKWWDNKVLPELQKGNRIIQVLYDRGIMRAYSLLKLGNKPKICTLQVLDKHKGMGYGRRILNSSLQVLKNPVITVSESKLSSYSSILSEYGFEKVGEVFGLYAKDQTEYIFKHI